MRQKRLGVPINVLHPHSSRLCTPALFVYWLRVCVFMCFHFGDFPQRYTLQIHFGSTRRAAIFDRVLLDSTAGCTRGVHWNKQKPTLAIAFGCVKSYARRSVWMRACQQCVCVCTCCKCNWYNWIQTRYKVHAFVYAIFIVWNFDEVYCWICRLWILKRYWSIDRHSVSKPTCS